MNMTIQNLFSELPADMPNEVSNSILSADSIQIERIVSHGHASPAGFWYDQEMAEWVLVLQGKAKLRLEGEEKPLEMGPGDHINIPAHRRHRVEWTTPDSPTVWLAIHYG